MRFGARLQTEHGKLAERELVLADSEALAKGRRLGAELLQRLGDLDPDRVFAVRGGVLKAIKALAAPRDADDLFFPRYRPRRKNSMRLRPTSSRSPSGFARSAKPMRRSTAIFVLISWRGVSWSIMSAAFSFPIASGRRITLRKPKQSR
ncbi:hypothetical protein [Rhizobium pisi]